MHPKLILQDLTRQIADAIDDETICPTFAAVGDRGTDDTIITIGLQQPVTSGRARNALNDFLINFADAYLGDCPDARTAKRGPCKRCGAADTRDQYDHLLLDYGHAYREALIFAGRSFPRTIFAAETLQPRLAA